MSYKHTVSYWGRCFGAALCSKFGASAKQSAEQSGQHSARSMDSTRGSRYSLGSSLVLDGSGLDGSKWHGCREVAWMSGSGMDVLKS